MGRSSKFLLILLAISAGILTAYAISITLYKSDLNSTLEWGLTISLLALGFGAAFSMLLPGAWKKFLDVPVQIRFWGMALTVSSAACFSISAGIIFLIPFAIIGFILTSFTFPSLHKLINEKRALHFIIACMFSGLVSFFALGFFKNFYPSFLEFLAITIALNALLYLLLEHVLAQIIRSLKYNPSEKIIPAAVLALGPLLIALTLRILVQYPTLFSPGFFLPKPLLIPAFFGLTILSQGWTAVLIQKLDSQNWQSSPFITGMQRNLPGLLLASAISTSTYLLGTALVSTNLAFMDIYFHSDSPFWLNFLTFKADEIIIMRAVHPFILLILRPPVWLMSLLLHGDKYHAALLLNSIVGGVCVYLTWLFFKQRTGNTPYALLLAALLGFSTSHLLWSSFLESYIFSAAALIAFTVLLQSKDGRFSQIASAGLVVFGITITNFIQTCVAFLLVRRDIKAIIKYVTVVLALGVLLAFVQHVFYPTSDPFYVTKNFKAEGVYRYDYLDIPREEGIRIFKSRVNTIFRNTALFSIVAPRPLIYTDDVSCFLPCFRVMRFFRGEFRFASYIGFGSWLVRTWFLGLVIAGIFFIWKLFKSPKATALQAALFLNIIFNFILHLNYGDDPMLYSPNWTYAIVFFFGMSFEKLADKKWMQIILLVFLTTLLFNNVELFHKILDTILPFRT